MANSSFTPTVQQSPVVLATVAGVEGTVNPYNTGSASVVVGGTYTPTVSGSNNCTVNTVQEFRYSRVGPIVTVSGICNVSATASSGCEFLLTLPIASALTTSYQVSGNVTHAQVGASYAPGGVLSDAAGDKAQVVWRSNTDTASRELYIAFNYRII